MPAAGTHPAQGCGMNRPFSIYLDLVRFTAAVLVYLWHSNQRALVQDILPASSYGHSAVIVFFVLSGYVIAYVTDTKEKTWVSYSASRLSRVLSVTVPAVFLTLLLDTAGRSLYPAIYAQYPYDQLVVRAIGSLLLLNEVWFISITSFSNVPYWSIAFEFWYYVLFALAMFMPPRWRVAAVLGCALLVGPKIMLLLPIWYAGVLLYRWSWLHNVSLGFGWALVVISTAGIVVFHALGVGHAADRWTEALLGSANFRLMTFARHALGDYGLCLLVFLNFAGVRRVAPSVGALLLAIERPVRWAAGYTFTLYLLHQPLFLFWTAVVRGDPRTHWFWVVVTALTAVSILVVGHFTENKRYGLRLAIGRMLTRLESRWRRPPPTPGLVG